MKIQLYDIITQRDTNSTPDTLFQSGETDEGGNGTTFDVIGCLPFSSDAFCQFYNVKKVTHITLDQGKNHVHRVRYTPNRVMSQEVQMRCEYSMAKFTCYTLIIAHGLPSNDITSKAVVSTGAVKLDIVTKIMYR